MIPSKNPIWADKGRFCLYPAVVKGEQENKKYLILFAWIYRLLYILITRGKQGFSYLFDILFGKNKIEEQNETMNKLGL